MSDEYSLRDEQLYRKMVDRAFEEKENKSFSNGRPQHAAYLMQKFFERAQSTIRLYSGCLKKQWGGVQIFESSGVIGAALEFLRQEGSRLTIVLEKDIDGGSPEDHPFLLAVKNAEPAIRGSVRVCAKTVEITPPPPHFMVMDKRGYRVETKADEIVASANVNDEPLAQRIASFFDGVLVSNSTPLWSSGCSG